MRSTITISLPQPMVKVIQKEVDRGRYGSTSDFFRHLVRNWEDAQIARDIRLSQKQMAVGQGKKLRSLASLR